MQKSLRELVDINIYIYNIKNIKKYVYHFKIIELLLSIIRSAEPRADEEHEMEHIKPPGAGSDREEGLSKA